MIKEIKPQVGDFETVKFKGKAFVKEKALFVPDNIQKTKTLISALDPGKPVDFEGIPSPS